jgi:hypothetical protein
MFAICVSQGSKSIYYGTPRRTHYHNTIRLRPYTGQLMSHFLRSFDSVSSLLHSCCHMFGYQLGLKAADRVRVSENALRIVLSLIALAARLSLYNERPLARS